MYAQYTLINALWRLEKVYVHARYSTLKGSTCVVCHTHTMYMYTVYGYLTEVDVKGGKVSYHGHTHNSQQSYYSDQYREYDIRHLCNKEPDTIIT